VGTHTLSLKRVLDMTPDIGLDNYPIFDESYRDKLNDKIIRHYFTREIGHETISLFRYQMETKMGEIMPLYNQHYVLSLLEIDPLSTMSIKNITEMDSTGNTVGNSESTSGSKGKSRAVVSDTPQTQLSFDQDYATALQDNISESDATGTGNETQETTQTGVNDSTTSGYQGHAPLLILQARQALVNVDMMVINDLAELFMLVWSNDDSFTDNYRPYMRGINYRGY